MSKDASQSQAFTIERKGDIAIISPSAEVELMADSLMEQAATAVMSSLQADPPVVMIFDLSEVDYIGSVFLSFLLRFHKRVKLSRVGSEVVVTGASPRARELLHLTALDTLWAIYDDRDEALEALSGD
jgi:anti-sigma B factor antagonist